MERQGESWGGEVLVPAWLRRLLRRPVIAATDTPERAHEARQTSQADVQALHRMRAAGTLDAHHSELPR